MAAFVHIVAGCLLNGQNQLLLVRKRGSAYFMLPGGTPEHGETPFDTLAREWQQGLGGTLGEKDLVLLGRFRAPAANAADTTLDADVFVVTAAADGLQPNGDIEELRWLALPPADEIALAPLLEREVLPALRDWL